jgi:hypothetical protein
VRNKITNSVEQCPSWEANIHSASQEISHILWTLKIQYHVHKSLQLVSSLSHMNPILTLTPYYTKRSILVLSSNPTKFLHAFLTSPMHPTCTNHPILISSPEYVIKSINYEAPHYGIFHSILLLTLSYVQIFSSAPHSQTPSIYILHLIWAPTNYCFVYSYIFR